MPGMKDFMDFIMDKATITAIVAILCIALVGICAIFAGLDGYLLTVTIASIAGLGGYFGARQKFK